MAHSAPHSRPPPHNTPWYDPWRVVTGRAPSAPRASRVRVRLSLLNPTTTLHHPPWRPTKRRARVSHARNASVTLAIRNLGMKRRRTSYPTPKSTHALSVSEFWSEGPKRQRPPSMGRLRGRLASPRRLDRLIRRSTQLISFPFGTSAIEYSTQICIELVVGKPIPFPCSANFVHDRKPPY